MTIIDILSIVGIDFLCYSKAIENLSICSKNYNDILNKLFPGIAKKIHNICFKIKDPFGRIFQSYLGFTGVRILPKLGGCRFDTFLHKTKLKKIWTPPIHLLLVIDSSGSTGNKCCEILEGEYSGSKSVLDIIKMVMDSIMEILQKQSTSLNVKKISIIDFNSTSKLLTTGKLDDIILSSYHSLKSNGGTNYNNMITFVKNHMLEWSY